MPPQELPNDKPHPPARRRFGLRFSLRSLLVVVTTVCLVSGYWFNRAHRQRTAVRRFYELTAIRKSAQGENLTAMGYRYQGKDEYKPIIPEWLHPSRDVLGEEAFGELTGVQLLDTLATDHDLRYLAEFPMMERVSLSRTQVTDEGLRHLLNCPKLRSLQLDNLPITDAGLAQLTVLQKLESISLSGTRITDAGLAHLAKLPKLKELWLRQTAISDAGYRQLQAKLPACQIQADVPAYFQKHQHLTW